MTAVAARRRAPRVPGLPLGSLPAVFEPQALYHFTDPGSFGTDYSGNAKTLTLEGTSGDDTGLTGDAYDQQGQSDRWYRSDADLRIAGDLSLLMLVKTPVSFADPAAIVLQCANANSFAAERQYEIAFFGPGSLGTYGVPESIYLSWNSSGGDYGGAFPYTFPSDTWLAVAVTRRASDGRCYCVVNGEVIGTFVVPTMPNGGASTVFSLGNHGWSVPADRRPYQGLIQTVGVYSSYLPLSAAVWLSKATYDTRPTSKGFGPARLTRSNSPEGLWLFKDATNWGLDSSGNGNHLTTTGTFTPSTGRDGETCVNDDSGGLLSLSVANSAPFRTTGAITLEAVVYAGINVDDSRLIAGFSENAETEDENILWSLRLEEISGVLHFNWAQENGAGNNNTYISTFSFAGDRWVHVAATRDAAGTGIKFYLNGLLVESTTLANAATGGTSARLHLTQSLFSVDPYNFEYPMEGVKVSLAELSHSAIAKSYINTFYSSKTGLQSRSTEPRLPDLRAQPEALWLLNGAGAPKLADSSENARALTLATGTEVSAAGPEEGSTAWHFDGATRLGSTDAAFDIDYPVSVMCWFRLDASINTFNAIFGYGDNEGGSDAYYGVIVEDGSPPTIDASIKSGSAEWVTSGTGTRAKTIEVEKERWYHCALVKPTPEALVLYLDGVVRAEQYETLVAAGVPATKEFNVGAKAGASFPHFFQGRISGVKFFPRALGPADVQNEYRMGRGRPAVQGPLRGLSNRYNPVAQWHFNNSDRWGYNILNEEDNDYTADYEAQPTGAAPITASAPWGGAAWQQDSTSGLQVSAVESTGLRSVELTLQLLVYPISGTAGRRDCTILAGPTDTEADNVVWAFGLFEVANGRVQLLFMHEYGAGTNEIVQTIYEFEQDLWSHIAVTRNAAGDELRFYHNGQHVETIAVNAFTGGDGSASTLEFGRDVTAGSNDARCVFAGHKVHHTALSETVLRSEYDYAFNGRPLPRITGGTRVAPALPMGLPDVSHLDASRRGSYFNDGAGTDAVKEPGQRLLRINNLVEAVGGYLEGYDGTTPVLGAPQHAPVYIERKYGPGFFFDGSMSARDEAGTFSADLPDGDNDRCIFLVVSEVRNFPGLAKNIYGWAGAVGDRWTCDVNSSGFWDFDPGSSGSAVGGLRNQIQVIRHSYDSGTGIIDIQVNGGVVQSDSNEGPLTTDNNSGLVLGTFPWNALASASYQLPRDNSNYILHEHMIYSSVPTAPVMAAQAAALYRKWARREY